MSRLMVCTFICCAFISAGLLSAISSSDALDQDVSSPETVVQGQLERYNARDLDGFMAFYSDSVKVYSPPHTLRTTGKAALRKQYEALFAQAPNLQATVQNRLVHGRFIIDQEQVTGLPNNRTLDAVAIYEVVDEQITNVWFLAR